MTAHQLKDALWKIYRRPERPFLWHDGGNLPWHESDFSARMLREHLSEAHGAASRQTPERLAQIDWLWTKLALEPDQHLLDVTCGPGLYAVELARRGLTVTGLDFGPAAIAYAQELAETQAVNGRTTFIQTDVRAYDFPQQQFDAALLIYGQLAVFPPAEAAALLQNVARALKPGGKLCVELLNQGRVDKSNSTWWYTDDDGLWGAAPYLHLGERFWDADTQTSTERFQILHLETGRLDEIILCDKTYAAAEAATLMTDNGFTAVTTYPAWDGLPLYDAEEWMVYVAER